MKNRPNSSQISDLIEHFQLSPHPEGGWYREVVRSHTKIVRADGQKRNNITAILFLLGTSDQSCWHRVKGADEVWIHLQGAPLNLWRLDPEKNELDTLKLDLINPVQLIPSGWWQAAVSEGAFTLVSCCVGPGFDFADFEMLRDVAIQNRPDKAKGDLI